MGAPRTERARLLDNIRVARRHFLTCIEVMAQYERARGGAVVRPLPFEELAVTAGALKGLFRRHL